MKLMAGWCNYRLNVSFEGGRFETMAVNHDCCRYRVRTDGILFFFGKADTA